MAMRRHVKTEYIYIYIDIRWQEMRLLTTTNLIALITAVIVSVTSGRIRHKEAVGTSELRGCGRWKCIEHIKYHFICCHEYMQVVSFTMSED